MKKHQEAEYEVYKLADTILSGHSTAVSTLSKKILEIVYEKDSINSDKLLAFNRRLLNLVNEIDNIKRDLTNDFLAIINKNTEARKQLLHNRRADAIKNADKTNLNFRGEVYSGDKLVRFLSQASDEILAELFDDSVYVNVEDLFRRAAEDLYQQLPPPKEAQQKKMGKPKLDTDYKPDIDKENFM